MRGGQLYYYFVFAFGQIIGGITVSVKHEICPLIGRAGHLVIDCWQVETAAGYRTGFAGLRIISNRFDGSFLVQYKRNFIFCRLCRRLRSICCIINVGSFAFHIYMDFIFRISHDTRLFREGGTTAAELLLLAPGAVQIFYGDESSRPFGPTGSDPLQGTRSEMNWQDVNGKAARSVTHWQKIGQFRARHPAIGMGKQTTLSMPRGYGFVRESGEDKVMVIWAGQQQ